MKQSIIIGALALSLTVGGTAFAQTTSTTTSGSVGVSLNAQTDLKAALQAKKDALSALKTDIQNSKTTVQADIQASKDALQTLIKTKKDALKAEIDKVKKERATVRKGYVDQKLRQVVSVIEDHQAKIKTAIDALNAQGTDTTDAQKELDASHTDLQVAVEALGNMANVTVSDDNKTSLDQARTYAKAAEDALKSARAHVVAAIEALKKITGQIDTDTNVQAQTSVNANASVNAGGSTTTSTNTTN